jgi:hypothetical protein
MEQMSVEIAQLETTENGATDAQFRELAELRLASGGGGLGEVAFA